MRKSRKNKFVHNCFKCHEIDHKATACSANLNKSLLKPKRKKSINMSLSSAIAIKTNFDECYIDSACADHMTDGRQDILTNYTKTNSALAVTLSNNEKLIKIKVIQLVQVIQKKRIFSEDGFKIYQKEDCEVTGQLFTRLSCIVRLYELDTDPNLLVKQK